MHRPALPLLLASTLGACFAAPSPPAPPAPRPVASAVLAPPPPTAVAAVVEKEDDPPLPFRAPLPEEDRWIRDLRACAGQRARALGLAGHDAWGREVNRSIWNETWCDLQPGETTCAAYPAKAAGTRWYRLTAQVQPVTQEAYYITVHAQLHPESGWGAKLLWVRELSSVTDHRNDPLFFRFELGRWVDGKLDAERKDSSQAVSELTADVLNIHTPPEGSPARLRRLLGGAESMRDAALEQVEGARAAAVASFRSGTLTTRVNDQALTRRPSLKCDWGPCEPRRLLTKKEREAGVVAANAAAEAESAMIRGEYRAQWAAVEALFPDAKCRELLR